MVSCSALSSSESMVAAAFGSSDPPHVEQNRPLEETCAPQEEQYMGRRDSIIARRLTATCNDGPRCELRNALDLDGGTVSQNFGYALHDFGGVIAHADDGVRAVFAGVLQKEFVGVFAGLLAEVREDGDIAADDCLESSAEISDDAARADDNPPDDSEVSNDAVAGKFGSRRDHAGVNATSHLFSP